MGLYIVGMHRSGTSAITEALASLPFELPPAEALVGANSSNPRGHWEVEALIDFNERLLERLGGSWLAPPTRMVEDVERLAQPGASVDLESAEVFARAFSGDSWLFKDPRLSFTLPFWRRMLPENRAVLVLRDPLAIALSLRARNSFPVPFGLALWERYMRSAVVALDGMEVHVATFSGVASGGQAAADLFSFAAASLGTAVPEDVKARIDKSIDNTLRHHDRDPSVGVNPMSGAQHRLSDLLLSCEGSHARFHVDIDFNETEGLELAFGAAAGLHQASMKTIAGQRAELEADYLDRERGWSQRFEEDRYRSDSEKNFLLAELDRLRNVAAQTELEMPKPQEGANSQSPGIAKLRAELGQAANHRDFLASELEKLQSRRAVKLALRADHLLRKANVLPHLANEEGAITKGASESGEPAPSSISDFGPLASAIADGKLDRPLTVVIPVHNAADAFQRCIESFRRWTPDHVRLVVVDDASTDKRIGLVLDQLADRPNTKVLYNVTNRGFSGTVNRGLEAIEEQVVNGGPSDVILLNSDTILTPRWSQRLRATAHEQPMIATVTPLSNAAGVFSFGGPVPRGFEEVAARSTMIARASQRIRPTGPTGNGFCLFIKAEALDVVPRLDEAAFPRGYGEENDLCMKLDEVGWIHVVADDMAVFHEESSSFGDATRMALIEAGLAKLDERWPTYRDRAREFSHSERLSTARSVATAATATLETANLADSTKGLRSRVLIVLHDGGGGTDFHASDLWTEMLSTHEPFLLVPDGDALALWSVEDGDSRREIARWELASPWDVRTFTDPAIAVIAAEILVSYNIELVHIHHLIGHSFDVPRTARALGIPVVITLHDFYLACPSINLIDDTGTWCGGTCTAGHGRCNTPAWVAPGIGLKNRFVRLWRHETEQLLSQVEALVAPSTDTKERYEGIFGQDLARRVTVIEHGRDFGRQRIAAKSPADGDPVRILLVGGINVAKGAALLADLNAAALNRNVSIEILGDVESQFDGQIASHGKYQREELPELLARIRPTFIGVFSIWAETHCYVVSEAWANGIPVLVGPLGAPAERVRMHGAGVVVPSLDPRQFVDEAVKAARDRLGYARLSAQASLALVRTRGEMGDDYRALYAKVLESTGGRAENANSSQ